ncbi:MAG: acyltransferase [Bilifractor sp.]|jgi:surface polysaccharide O-acyltransferase-like enzyme
MGEKQTRIKYFTWLRAISCIAIVFLHTFYCAVRLFRPGGMEETGSLIVRNCMIFAVPCFVMVTGALLLNPGKTVTVRSIFQKYLRRILIALVVFTFIFALFDRIVDHQGGGAADLVIRYLKALITDGSWLHMWYLYMLIGLYLMLPLYRIFVRYASDKELRYLLILFLVFQSMVPTVEMAAGGSSGFYILVYTIYPLYAFLGYAIHYEKIRISLPAAVLMLVIGTCGLIVITWFGWSAGLDNLQSLASSYSCILSVLQAVGVFSLMKRTESLRMNASGRILQALDGCSFGIYLIHVLVLYIIYRVFRFNPYLHGGLAVLVVLALITLAVSWAVIRLLKFIPGVKQIL